MEATNITSRRLRIEKADVKPAIAVRVWHRVQERVRQPAVRRALAGAIAAIRHTTLHLPISQAHSQLLADGVTMFPGFVSPEQAAELKRLLEGLECSDPWKPMTGSFRHDHPPPGTHVADIAAAPTLLALHELALDRRLLRLAAGYFRCRPYLDSIQAWWSLSGNDEPEEAENFHRDNDSIRFLKFFLYLTDVDEDHGPHKFVIGSHTAGRLLARRRLTDNEVEQAFGAANVRTMTGRAGDAFIEDTFGIHKGQLPRTGNRLLVQFRYSVTPTVFRSPLLVESCGAYDPSEVTSLLHRRA